MKIILENLMKSYGHTAYDIHQGTGIQPSTIYRFLGSVKGDLKGSTVQKIARFYGVTESQLRGDIEIDGIETPVEQHELQELLTPDEYRLVSNIKNMSREGRDMVYRLTEMLAEEPKAVYQFPFPDRRKQIVYPNNQLRAGERYHQESSPLMKRRLKDPLNGRKNLRPTKSSHTA